MVFKIKREWMTVLGPEMAKPYFKNLTDFLKQAYGSKSVYPKVLDIFRALNLTAPSNVKVVILGQDPYHGPNQANGLAFSVNKGEPLPPSLRNIYIELLQDMKAQPVEHGDLSDWASQGVLLLNSTLTVQEGLPGSHFGKGWEEFTDSIISYLSSSGKPKVFILWGQKAQSKLTLIDKVRNRVVVGAHPSPMSAHSGFFGSKPFSKCNRALKELGHEPIRWRLNR